MAETSNSILQKLDGLESRFEEVSTLITDPAVIADQQRFVKLTKEYKDLGDIMDARKRYIACLNSIKEAKDILANEDDPEMKGSRGVGRERGPAAQTGGGNQDSTDTQRPRGREERADGNPCRNGR